MMTLLGIVVLAIAWWVRPSKWNAPADPSMVGEHAEAEVGWIVLVAGGLVFLAWPWL